MKTEGPKLRIVATCFDCVHCFTEGYKEQGDSGSMVRCGHPEKRGTLIGDTRWETPQWCPVYPVALAALLKAQV